VNYCAAIFLEVSICESNFAEEYLFIFDLLLKNQFLPHWNI
jgi:hypothetical protein